MVSVKLDDGQSAYGFVGEYIEKFWEKNFYCDVVVLIGTSRDGLDYCESVEIASPTEDMMGVEFLNDWHEGEPYVKVFGIKCVDDIEFTSDEGILKD